VSVIQVAWICTSGIWRCLTLFVQVLRCGNGVRLARGRGSREDPRRVLFDLGEEFQITFDGREISRFVQTWWHSRDGIVCQNLVISTIGDPPALISTSRSC